MTGPDKPLHDWSAAELSAAYRAGTLSPVEATRAVIDRVARWEDRLCALWAYEPERALAMARESEARWRAGTPLSALDGVPVTIKENIATRGVAVPLGCAATELAPAAADAPPAARLREAGCVFLAKTTMPDWGMLSSGLSSFHKLARNPWDLRLNPGGSSAGAAAAAAAGYGPLHLGTDIGGSVRLPAGWCGLFTLKPSLGRIPISPPFLGRVAGPMTRSVDDSALLMAQISRPDWRDAMSLPPQDLPWVDDDPVAARERAVQGLRGRRVGLLLDAGWGLPVEPEITAAVQRAARQFESAGAVVEPLAPFSTREMVDGLDRFWRMRSWLDYQALPAARQARVLPYIRDWILTAAGLDGAEVYRGFAQIGALRDAAVAACQPYDLVLSPVSPVLGFPAEWASPLDDPQRPFEHIAFTLAYNMSEQPAAAIRCADSAGGLPIGLQIAGRRHDDLGVLAASRAFEALRGPLAPWPEPPR